VTDYLLTDPGWLDSGDGEVRESERIYYDTYDGLLHSAGAELAYADGRLSCGERSVALAAPPGRVFAFELPAGSLRDELEPLLDVRAALPIARVRSRTTTTPVLDDQGKTVVRILVEEPSLVTSSGRAVPLRARLRLAPVRGYGAELERARRELAERFELATEPLVDEAVRAAGGAPEGIPSKIAVPLRAEQRSDAAAVAVLRRLLEVIEANVEGTIADIDSEFLHDFRVSIRRSRSVQRQLKGVFPSAELQHFRVEFRWLQQATGDARDLDVYVLEFDQYRAMVPEGMRGELEPLLVVLRSRRLIARREMVRELRSERAVKLRADWAAFLDELVGLPDDERPAAAEHIGKLSSERINKVYKRMLKMGGAIDSSSPPAHYHELRKVGKELRYLLELFGDPLHPGVVVKPMIRALKGLQDVLGRHQDREIQVATLRSLRDEVAALPGGAAALMAMGVLVERLEHDQRQARGEFAAHFAEFSSKAKRGLVKDTFS
jgi:CHAD domain-containing protein